MPSPNTSKAQAHPEAIETAHNDFVALRRHPHQDAALARFRT
ncbi:hypothetical protein ACFVYE_35660 [Streptomyces sp. NPDC058239]